MTRSKVLGIAARLAALALVAWVIASQVHGPDEITLASGETIRGRIVETPGAERHTEPSSIRYEVTPDDGGPTRDVHAGSATSPRDASSTVATRRVGGRDVPQVAYGMRTLAGRLSGALPAVGAVLLALFLLALVTAWRWRWLVHALGLVLTAGDAIRYTLYGIFFNLVVPGATGGDVVKSYYAAKRTGVATKAVVSVFVDRFVGLFALVLFAAGVLFLGPNRDGFGPPRLLVAAVLGGAVGFGGLVLSRRARKWTGLSALLKRLPYQHVLREVDAAFRLYRSHPRSLGLGLLVSLANHAGGCLCAYVLARGLGITGVTLSTAFALVPVVSLLSAIPVLPGGFGVGEVAFAYFFGQVGVPPTEAVALSVVYRLAVLVVGLPGGVLWMVSREHTTRREMADAVHAAEEDAERIADAGETEGGASVAGGPAPATPRPQEAPTAPGRIP